MSAPVRMIEAPKARIIDGRALAASMRKELAERVAALRTASGIVPGLAVILVGEDAPSALYVANKVKACQMVGIASRTLRREEDISTSDLLALISELNDDPAVHGILVQLPLPRHIDMDAVLDAIDVAKDVDGFHLYNVGGLVTGSTVFSPCTPYGVLKLLEHADIPIEGQHCRPGSQHNQAVFAFKLAREATGMTVPAYITGSGSRLGLSRDPAFMDAFAAAKARIRAMEYRCVEETDQTRQALLELYCAITLGCPYNDFNTH